METLDNEKYKNIYKAIEKYRIEEFKKKINEEEFDYEHLNIDNFYNASNNIVLFHLKRKDFEKSKICSNFHKNLCKPLFEQKKNNNNLLNIIGLIFNPNEYEKIQKDF